LFDLAYPEVVSLRALLNCDEPFELAFPEGTVRVGYDECDNDNLKNHNLEPT
jgi:hypothetical protein